MHKENVPPENYRPVYTDKWAGHLYFFILSVYAYGNFVYEIFPDLTFHISVIRALCDALFLVVGVKFFFRNENTFLRYLIAAFILISTVTYKLNASLIDFRTHLNGLREPLMLMTSLAVLTSVFKSTSCPKFIKKMNRFLLVFLIIQVPVAVYQFLQYGAGDLVGGTFSDGGSGMLSQLIFLGVYYFILVRAARPNGVGFRLEKAVPYLLLFIPVFINQTKISFIFFAVLAILQIRIQLNLVKVLLTAVSGMIVLFLFVRILAVTTEIDLADYLDPDNIEKDFFSDWTEAEDITRFGKVVLAYDLFENEPIKHVWGAGYGLMKGKTVMETSEAGRDMERLYYGSRIQFFTAYLQGGLVFAVLLLILNFYYFSRSKNTGHRYNFVRYKTFAFFLFVTLWFYNDALLVTYFSLIASYFLVFTKYGELQS